MEYNGHSNLSSSPFNLLNHQSPVSCISEIRPRTEYPCRSSQTLDKISIVSSFEGHYGTRRAFPTLAVKPTKSLEISEIRLGIWNLTSGGIYGMTGERISGPLVLIMLACSRRILRRCPSRVFLVESRSNDDSDGDENFLDARETSV